MTQPLTVLAICLIGVVAGMRARFDTSRVPFDFRWSIFQIGLISGLTLAQRAMLILFALLPGLQALVTGPLIAAYGFVILQNTVIRHHQKMLQPDAVMPTSGATGHVAAFSDHMTAQVIAGIEIGLLLYAIDARGIPPLITASVIAMFVTTIAIPHRFHFMVFGLYPLAVARGAIGPVLLGIGANALIQRNTDDDAMASLNGVVIAAGIWLITTAVLWRDYRRHQTGHPT